MTLNCTRLTRLSIRRRILCTRVFEIRFPDQLVRFRKFKTGGGDISSENSDGGGAKVKRILHVD